MDELLFEAIESILSAEMASKAYLQREFRIGYERASKLMNAIESMGIVGPEINNQQRSINISLNEWASFIERRKGIELLNRENKSEDVINLVQEDKHEQSTFAIDEIWNKVREQLRTELSENSYNKWFQDVWVQHTGNKIMVITQNDFHKEVIESRYISLITHLFHLFADSDLTVCIVTTKNTI